MKTLLASTFIISSIIIAGTIIYSSLKKKKMEILKKKVYFNMDGNNDDFVAFLLLLNFRNVELVGIAITPADCDPNSALEFVTKILHKRGLKVPIVISDVEPVNDFPDAFKQTSIKANYLPTLLNIEDTEENQLDTDASEHMYTTLKKIYEETQEKVTFLITGPPSSLVKAMKSHPEIKDYIEEVFWMGGAIDVSGNVGDSPYSEYNAYWDPTSTKEFIESGLSIKILSLDATNSVPVNKNLLSRLSKISGKYEAANLANEIFAIAYFIDPEGLDTYFAWDCMASMALGYDDLITFKEAKVDVITEKSETDNQEGRIMKNENSKNIVKYGQPLDSKAMENFYEAFINTLKYNL